MAADWPQWRGPKRDNVSTETGLLKTWPEKGPKLLWIYRNAGLGYSGPAIVGDRLYTMGTRDGTEYLIALDLKNSAEPKEAWAVKVGPFFTFKGNSWGGGPRATPTVQEGLVYGLGGLGDLVCVDAASGQEKWRKSMPNDLGGQVNPIGGGPKDLGWGWTWSPLVDGDHVICVPGGPQGTVAALDKKTGDLRWRSKDVTDQCSYSSPIVAEVGGIRHYIVMTVEGVTGVSAKDGSVVWRYLKKPPYSDVVIPTPLFHEGYVFVTNGHGSSGCDLIKLTATNGKIQATRVHSNKNMQNEQGGVVLIGGYVYGYSEGKGWICQDFLKGKIVWNEKNELGAGSLTYADGNLYCFGQDEGTVALVAATSKGWEEKGRFDIPEKREPPMPNARRWTPPVVANGQLYLRDQDLIFCYEVKSK
jgi:outer membrane protein assembly factor BamB